MTPTLAMAWYTPESWERLQAVAADKLCGRYAEFVRQTTQRIHDFEECGVKVEKVLIDVDHMVAWLKRWGHRVDSRGRAMYGALLAMHDGKLFDLDTPLQLPGQQVH